MGFLTFLWIVFSLVLAAWAIVRVFYQTVQIEVKTQPSDARRRVTVLTSAENKLPIGKHIGYAFLLVGPEGESPVVTAQHVAAGTKLKDDHNLYISRFHVFSHATNVKGGEPQSITDGLGRWLIPLPFYYDEHASVKGEKLTYRCSVDTSGLEPDTAYSVRFYVFSQQQPFLPRRLYRSVQDLIVP